MRAEIYPDSDDTTSLGNGTDGTYDRIEYMYNIQGDRIERKDQNGTVHTYEYDDAGRVTHDRVTTVGQRRGRCRAAGEHDLRYSGPS